MSHRFIAGLIMMPALLAAQESTGRLEGWVTDSAGQGLGQVEIVVAGTGLPQARLTMSNPLGFYRVEDLPVGHYSVRLRRIGYRPMVFDSIGIRLGQTITLPRLELAAMVLDLPEIRVTADYPLLDLASAAGGGTIVVDQFEDLPVERSYQELPALLPGVSARAEGLNIAGATGLENQFFIDGANVTDMYRGMTSTILPYNFIQDVHVRTGGYEAEHRGALGGVVDVVTRSGGNRFSGQVFGYFLNNRLTADERTVAGGDAGQSFTRYDAGASLGGPLIRDRLWFFAAYNPSVDKEEVQLAGLGTWTDRATRHSFAGKLTWQPGARTTVVTSVLGDPATREAVGATFASYGSPSGFANPDPWLGRLRSGGVSLSTQLSHTLTDRLHLTGKFSWSQQREDNGPETALGPEIGLFVDPDGIWSGGYPDDIRITNERLTGGVAAALSTGAHQLKFGAEFMEQRLTQYQFDRSIQQDNSGYGYFEYFSDGPVKNRVPSLYLQDGWAVTPRLRVNLGLRWDGEYLYGSDGRLALSIEDEWQPRLGVVWQPDRAGRSRVFASWGRFYQDLHSSAGSTYHAYGTRFDFLFCSSDPRVDMSGCDPRSAPVAPVSSRKIEGQGFDELSVGYERALTTELRARARYTRRRLLWGIEDGYDFDGNKVLGNPGRGVLGQLARMRREYDALELALEGHLAPRLFVMASYVVSRSYGNHSGLYYADYGVPFPNVTGAFDIPEILGNATGRLPNDIPHALKLNAAYAFSFGLGVGTTVVWQSGTPISEFGAIYQSGYQQFVTQRGTAGRTPGIWDVGFRLKYGLERVFGHAWRPTALLDLYHIGSSRSELTVDQTHYTAEDSAGNQTDPNTNYLRPTSFQPPMSARLGVVVAF